MHARTALFATLLSSAVLSGAAPGWAAGPAAPAGPGAVARAIEAQAPRHADKTHSLRLSVSSSSVDAAGSSPRTPYA